MDVRFSLVDVVVVFVYFKESVMPPWQFSLPPWLPSYYLKAGDTLTKLLLRWRHRYSLVALHSQLQLLLLLFQYELSINLLLIVQLLTVICRTLILLPATNGRRTLKPVMVSPATSGRGTLKPQTVLLATSGRKTPRAPMALPATSGRRNESSLEYRSAVGYYSRNLYS